MLAAQLGQTHAASLCSGQCGERAKQPPATHRVAETLRPERSWQRWICAALACGKALQSGSSSRSLHRKVTCRRAQHRRDDPDKGIMRRGTKVRATVVKIMQNGVYLRDTEDVGFYIPSGWLAHPIDSYEEGQEHALTVIRRQRRGQIYDGALATDQAVKPAGSLRRGDPVSARVTSTKSSHGLLLNIGVDLPALSWWQALAPKVKADFAEGDEVFGLKVKALPPELVRVCPAETELLTLKELRIGMTLEGTVASVAKKIGAVFFDVNTEKDAVGFASSNDLAKTLSSYEIGDSAVLEIIELNRRRFVVKQLG